MPLSTQVYFASPFNRASSVSSRESRKRKRQSSAESNEDAREVPASPEDNASNSAKASLQPEIVRQYEKAGQAFDEELPGGHFPHQPADFRLRARTLPKPSQVEEELASLKPPLAIFKKNNKPPEPHRSSLRQQHIFVLFALVHRCLLRRDYPRARRAFGMLLRTESLGKTVDLRNQSLWGIGAEILLQDSEQISGPDPERLNNSPGYRQSSSNSNELPIQITKQGFESARQYYEQLILEFFYRASSPDLLSAYHIYPALFTLWISFLDQQHKDALSAFEKASDYDEHSDSQSDTASNDREELVSIRNGVLEGAKELAKRMDEVLSTHPYSDDRTLWQMRGNFQIWMDQLSSDRTRTESSDSVWAEEQDETNPDPKTFDHQRKFSIEAEEAFTKAKMCSRDSSGRSRFQLQSPKDFGS